AALDAGLERVWRWLRQSRCFETGPRPPYGNLLLVRLREPFDAGGEERFFFQAMLGANVATLVGGCFGFDPDAGVWFRIAIGGSDPVEVIAALERLEAVLIGGKGP